ncbi:MAG: response regulator [Candidatus Omnitrophica bacterium]|nr:response regulator [Candidatus Omnitrophota bacterium]
MSKKILVIDDEPTILVTLRDRLRMEGYEVITATDGSAAMEAAINERPDIIIMDIMLPDISGYQLCKDIKEIKEINAGIIMMTNKIDAVDAVKAREHGADDFIVTMAGYDAVLESIKNFI